MDFINNDFLLKLKDDIFYEFRMTLDPSLDISLLKLKDDIFYEFRMTLDPSLDISLLKLKDDIFYEFRITLDPSLKPKKKIAILLTGQLRTWRMCKGIINSLKKHNTIDIFMSVDLTNSQQHAWLNSTDETNLDELKKAIDFYKPVNYYYSKNYKRDKFSKFLSKIDNFSYNRESDFHLSDISKIALSNFTNSNSLIYEKLYNRENKTKGEEDIFNKDWLLVVAQQYYFVYKAYKLLENHINFNKTDYDTIIRLRFDQYLLNSKDHLLFNDDVKYNESFITKFDDFYNKYKFDIVDCENNNIYVFDGGLYKNYAYVNDQFYIHDKNLIDTMKNFYIYLPRIIKNSFKSFWPCYGCWIEHFFAYYLKKKEIIIKKNKMSGIFIREIMENKKKIFLFINHEYNPDTLIDSGCGASEVLFLKISEALSLYFDVTVYQRRNKECRIKNIEYKYYQYPIHEQISHIDDSIIIVQRCFEDVIKMHKSNPSNKYFIWSHDFLQVNDNLFGKLSKSYINDYIDKNNIGVIAVSNFHKNNIKSLLPNVNVTIIYNALFPEILYKHNDILRDKNKIIFASSWSKGLDKILKIGTEYYKLNKDFKLILIKPNYCSLKLDEKKYPFIEKLGCIKDKKEYCKLIQGCLCVLTTSFSETFGCVFAEALHLGVPVIGDTTIPSGFLEIIPREYTCKFGNTRDVIRIIEQLRDNRPCVNLDNKFYINSVSKEWITLLESCS
jgi:hypothetical protein